MSGAASSSARTLRIGTLGSAAMLRGDLRARIRLLETVADAGLDHLFIADHVSFHNGTGMDGIVNAATLLASHPTLEVVIGVYLLALRHPLPVARQLATLAESAPGRLTLGVGVGGEDRNEVAMCGVDPATRGRRTDEALAVLRPLLAGATLNHAGEFFSFERARIRPVPEPMPPIVIGGRSDAAIRRTARFGDGWLGTWCSPARFAAAIGAVGDQAAAAGRGTVDWRHGMQVWVGVDDDADRARQRLAERMEQFYRVPFAKFARYSPAGDPRAIATFLAGYRDAGCTLFNLMPVAGDEAEGVHAIAEVARLLRAGIPASREAAP